MPTLFLPASLDEYVGPDNPVRFIDAFVDGLGERLLLYRGIRQVDSFYNISRFSGSWFRVGRDSLTRLVLLFEVGISPPHDGFGKIGWFNLVGALADGGWQGLQSLRTHLIRRPREDIFLPEQNSLNF